MLIPLAIDTSGDCSNQIVLLCDSRFQGKVPGNGAKSVTPADESTHPQNTIGYPRGLVENRRHTTNGAVRVFVVVNVKTHIRGGSSYVTIAFL